MAKKEPVIPTAAQIGEVAGAVWQALSEKGPLSYAKLLKVVPESRDTVMQAIGWLAREGKLVFSGTARTQTIALRDEV
jgi:hypothetical protein